MANKNKPITATEEAKNMLKQAGDIDLKISGPAREAIADSIGDTLRENFSQAEHFTQAVDSPIQEGVLDGDVVSFIYQEEDFTDNLNDMIIPLDLLTPGTEKDHIAYVIPEHGKIPHRNVEADYIQLNVYQIGSSIDCTRKFFRNGRMDVLRRMIEILQMGFVKKNNDDGWQTLLAGADGRGIISYDTDATAGQFTPKLVSIMKTVMRRNGGGNSSSINRRRLTDLYMSPEAFEDMSNWGLNLVPDDVRSTIFRSTDGAISNLYGVTFHDLDELGVGQEYQLFWTGGNGLNASLGPASDEELVIGLDLTNRSKAFIRPVSERVQVFEDNTYHRQGMVSFYGNMEGGWAVLDTRYLLAGSF